MDFVTHADLTGRLRGLVILLADSLTSEQAALTDELIDASEFGLALETLSDWLAEQRTPVPADLRVDFARLASQMDISDRVMGSLNRCPP
jgi:hypothetical protein